MGIYEPDCDDVTEDGICLGDMVYCDENRRRFKLPLPNEAVDFFKNPLV